MTAGTTVVLGVALIACAASGTGPGTGARQALVYKTLGPGDASADQVKQLQRGMSGAQVRALLGNADVGSDFSRRRWRYFVQDRAEARQEYLLQFDQDLRLLSWGPVVAQAANAAAPTPAPAPAPVALPVPAPSPAVVAVPAPVPQASNPQDDLRAAQVLRRVEQWRRAWSRQDVDDYLARYASDFKPADGSSRERWRDTREDRLTQARFIRVEIQNPRVQWLPNNRAQAQFLQIYRSNRYQDQGEKTLVLRPVGKDWKIVSEEFVKQP